MSRALLLRKKTGLLGRNQQICYRGNVHTGVCYCHHSFPQVIQAGNQAPSLIVLHHLTYDMSQDDSVCHRLNTLFLFSQFHSLCVRSELHDVWTLVIASFHPHLYPDFLFQFILNVIFRFFLSTTPIY